MRTEPLHRQVGQGFQMIGMDNGKAGLHVKALSLMTAASLQQCCDRICPIDRSSMVTAGTRLGTAQAGRRCYNAGPCVRLAVA